ncbi:hypothetical protein ILYODFUR_001960 [Ilyodon furcidens]|uniref:Uncharacterized protein n=1 Tax=Ilyodon furcidens TaxID=33524 RepID=A0ABV0TFC1_9TELE
MRTPMRTPQVAYLKARIETSYLYRFHFVEESPDIIKRQVVKLIVSKSDSSLDLEVNQDAILQQLRRSLQKHGLGEVKLKWRKQSDGKTFHLKTKEDTKKDRV